MDMDKHLQVENLTYITQTIALDGQAIQQGFAALGRGITHEVIPHMRAWGDAYSQCIEQAYLRHHRRLPGNLRTKRGRKKRQAVVVRWFEHYLSVIEDSPAARAAGHLERLEEYADSMHVSARYCGAWCRDGV